MKTVFVRTFLVGCLSLAPLTGAYAGSEPKCMKCHKEGDFAGKDAEEIVKAARDIETHKKHKINNSLSDEELRAYIAELKKSDG
jgi:hypothetical protein